MTDTTNETQVEVTQKPCPNCDNRPFEHVQDADVLSKRTGHLMKHVWCHHCNFAGPMCDTEAEAITAWNRRSA